MRTSTFQHPADIFVRCGHCIAFFFGISALLLSGCGQVNSTIAVTPVRSNVTGVTGVLHGGQQPVSNAVVQLYAVGTGGDGSAATPLITGTPVTTDSNGGFSITNRFTCPSPSTLVYITGTGGNPGLGGNTNNAAIALMSALGQCGTLSSSTFVAINEISTAVSVFALAPYVTSFDHIGSGSNDQGALGNAFATVSQALNTTTGNVPGPNLPNGYGVPADQVNTVADILASCVNSAGGTSGDGSLCGNLFQYTGGASTTDTVTAALQIASNPSNNTTQLFSLVSPTAPYQPTLSAAPSAFVASVLPAVPSPVITPAGGSSFPVTVSIADSLPGSRVYYTTDGSTPTTASSLFITPFSISAPSTVKAIAIATGYANSAVASVGFGIVNPAYTVKTIGVCEPNLPIPCSPIAVVVNPTTNTVYVANIEDSVTTSNPSPKVITVIDGSTDTVSEFVQTPVKNPKFLAINQATNKIFIGDGLGFGVGLAALDEVTKTSTTLIPTGFIGKSLTLNSSTNKVYALVGGGPFYTVDATSNTVSTIASGGRTTDPQPEVPVVDVNPITNHVFVGGSPNILNIDGATNTIVDAFTASASSIAVNPVTNKVYFSTYLPVAQTGLFVYDPATLSVTQITSVSAGSLGSVVVNPNTNTIYSIGPSSFQVIDGATNTVTKTISVGGNVAVLTLDPGLNRVYVLANTTTYDGGPTPVPYGLYALDGATNNLNIIATSLSLGGVVGTAVNPITHKLYITDTQSSVIVVSSN
jgi:DNA-binding beta-propeller fold protein YncE